MGLPERIQACRYPCTTTVLRIRPRAKEEGIIVYGCVDNRDDEAEVERCVDDADVDSEGNNATYMMLVGRVNGNLAYRELPGTIVGECLRQEGWHHTRENEGPTTQIVSIISQIYTCQAVQ